MSYKVCKKCHYVHPMGGKRVTCYHCGDETYDVYSASYVKALLAELEAERELADKLWLALTLKYEMEGWTDFDDEVCALRDARRAG